MELFVRAQRVARRIVDEASAEDVAAETLTRALVSWRRVRAYAQPWVTRVATNLALDAVRRKQPELPLAASEEPEEAVVRRLVLVAGLRRLSRRQREVLVLRYVVGLDETEIAPVLGLSPGTVSTYARRGLAAMRRRFAADPEEVCRVLEDPA
ncbi:MAG TPA: sigma-70 family RNA polymerase sigma factor [Actinomycetota bacterium]|nr:sigma-70 family RNA polymerase sigma factor [Actinomycetota bacterium]